MRQTVTYETEDKSIGMTVNEVREALADAVEIKRVWTTVGGKLTKLTVVRETGGAAQSPSPNRQDKLAESARTTPNDGLVNDWNALNNKTDDEFKALGYEQP